MKHWKEIVGIIIIISLCISAMIIVEYLIDIL